MVSRTDVDIINRKSVFYFVHMDMQEIYETQHALGFRHVHTTVTQDYDDTSIIAFPDSIYKLTNGVVASHHQQSLFNPRTKDLSDVDYDCGWR